MTPSLTIREGQFLVTLARTAISEYLLSHTKLDPPMNTPRSLFEKAGVFITLHSVAPAQKLRGCIGSLLPTEPLAVATIQSAIDAATADERFYPLDLAEFKSSVVIELSVLTLPERLLSEAPAERLSEIRIGKDGLMVEHGIHRGILLPQVAPEQNWTAEEFLNHCCIKAGLPAEAWLDKRTRVERFQATIFEEKTPDGEVHLKE